MIEINDFIEVSSYQKAISLLNGKVDEVLQKYSWEDLACHPELKVRAIIKCANKTGYHTEEAKKIVEAFTQKLKHYKI